MKTSSPRYIIFTVALLLYSGHAVCAEIETKNVVAITTSSGTSDNTTETVYAGMYLCSPSDSAPGNADIADVTVRTDIAAALSIAKGERYQPVSLYGIRNDTSGKNVIDAGIGVTLDALANSIVGAAEVRVGSITAVHAPHGSAVIQRPVAVTGVVVAADAMGDSTVLIDTLGGVSAKRVEGAGDISITGIDVSARSSDATAGIDLAICGVSGDDAATMDGATTISGVTVKAQARNDARAVVLVTGMTGKGDTAAGDIALENITVTAESERASAEIQTMVYAVQNTGGDAVTTGRLTASARTAVSRTDADADGADTTGVVSESVLGVFGLYIRKGTAEARGDITVKAESVATGGDAPLGYSLAAGIYSARGITLGDSANRDPIGVDARAGTYAVALWGDNSAADDAQPHTTIVNGPARLSAKAASRSNDLALAKMPALPVTEAEYLGFGVNDVLLFSLNGQTMDNAGEPLRLFGAEHVHVRRGKLVLADRSRIVNQRRFVLDAAEDGIHLKTDLFSPGVTTVTIGDGTEPATLRLEGVVLSALGAVDGAHQTLFTSHAAFDLDRDFTLALIVEPISVLSLHPDAALAMTSLTVRPGSKLRFDALYPGFAAPLAVSADADIDGDVLISAFGGLFDLAPKETASYAVVSSQRKIRYAGTAGEDRLFSSYRLSVEDGVLIARVTRSDVSVVSAVRAGCSGAPDPTLLDLARAIDSGDVGVGREALTTLSACTTPEETVEVLRSFRPDVSP